MPAAKHLIILSFLFFGPPSSVSQTLSGKYELKRKTSYLKYDFRKDRTFRSQSSNAFGHGSTFSEGYYLIKEDTLLLFYEPISRPQLSKVQVVDQQDSLSSVAGQKAVGPNIAIIDLVIEDKNGDGLPNVAVALIKDEKVIAVDTSNDSGNAYVYTTGQIAQEVSITLLGYEGVKIKLDNYWGLKSNIKIELAESTRNKYNQEYKMEKYLIMSSGKSELVLRDMDGDESKFKKVKKGVKGG